MKAVADNMANPVELPNYKQKEKKKSAIFSLKVTEFPKRCELGPRLLLITNKSCKHAFDWYVEMNDLGFL